MNSVAQKQNSPPRENRMKLASVVTGQQEFPDRVLLFGPEGCGKSTWAAGAPSPIFIAAEDGTAQLNVARFPRPDSWQDVLDALETLRVEKHEYKTIAIDTLDAIEPLLWAYICERDKQKSIEAYGYGRGYVAALDEWRVFLSLVERLRREREMGIVMIAHSMIRTFKSPDTDDFDRYELKLNAKAGGLLKEWCDSVLFAHYETYASKDGNRAKGISTGARIVSTQRTAAFDSKNHYSLPETLPLNYDDYVAAKAARAPRSATELKLSISTKLEKLKDEETKKKATAAARKVGDNAAELAKIDNRLTALLSAEGENANV